MTATEVRDRLDQRFKLLVGSRRGLERHQTLRHAVTWSYDLLDDSERSLLERCSVFAGSFDVQSACAVAGSDEADEFAVLDLLDALVRKSLLVADRSTGRTRFSMLETIRQFAEEKLVARGAAGDASSAHAQHFADREAEIMALWDSPRQREAYDWFGTELANLRTAFRWAADHGDLDVAVDHRNYVGLLGFGVENYEPVAWAEELIEPAVAVDHSRVATLHVIASLCWMAGRVDDAIGYVEIGRTSYPTDRRTPPYAIEGWLGAAYVQTGQPERWAELCSTQLERRGDNHVYIRACRVFALAFSGLNDEAMCRHGRADRSGRRKQQPVYVYVCGRRERISPLRDRSRSRPGYVPSGIGDCPGQRQSLQRVYSRPQSRSLRGGGSRHFGGASTHLTWSFAITTTRAMSRVCARHWLSSVRSWTASVDSKRPPPSPDSR